MIFYVGFITWVSERWVGRPRARSLGKASSAAPSSATCCLLRRHCFPGPWCCPAHSVNRKKLEDLKITVEIQFFPLGSGSFCVGLSCYILSRTLSSSSQLRMRSFWKGIRRDLRSTWSRSCSFPLKIGRKSVQRTKRHTFLFHLGRLPLRPPGDTERAGQPSWIPSSSR